ncbi:ABC transporter substrate-binding protein [Aurantimonas sp. MSK8Z-1]|nr:ABC transporter substrate-binding protein [Aurantimonas sp. MSK8Z-1]MCW4116004.1 ABC transporter substrate-binding protein [Aurantimonas sp. MSK8Z-1]
MALIVDRRGLLRSGAAFSALALTGLPRGAFAAGTDMRCVWWGSAERNQRTQAVIDLYVKQNSGLAITGEPIAGSDYWVKLATAMAGRNIADIFQLEPSTISDYSGRGACMKLDPFVGSALDVSNFAEGTVKLTTIDGTLYGVGLGLNSFAMLYDADAMAAAKVEIPRDRQMTWTEFAALAKAFKANGPKKRNYWAAPYGARYFYLFDVWLRQKNKELFKDGGIGYDASDAEEWFAYWEDLRQNDLCVSADIQTRDDNSIETNSLTLGNSAIGFAYSNQLIGYQKLVPGTLDLTAFPKMESGPSGHYYRPGLIWSIGATSQNGEAAARFISYFVNDIEAGKILGVERGVPLSLPVREAILPGLNETEKKTIAYIDFLADKVVAYPPPAPIGANEFDRNVMRVVADQLAFGQIDVKTAAQNLVDRGKEVLSARK